MLHTVLGPTFVIETMGVPQHKKCRLPARVYCCKVPLFLFFYPFIFAFYKMSLGSFKNTECFHGPCDLFGENTRRVFIRWKADPYLDLKPPIWFRKFWDRFRQQGASKVFSPRLNKAEKPAEHQHQFVQSLQQHRSRRLRCIWLIGRSSHFERTFFTV